MTNLDSQLTMRGKEIWSYVGDKLRARGGHEDFVNTWYSLLVQSRRQFTRWRRRYYLSVSATSLAAATIPALIAFTTTTDKTTANVLRIVASALGVLIAFATAVAGVMQLGNRYRVYRNYSFALEDAGLRYLAAQDTDKAYAAFTQAVTRARQDLQTEYMRGVAVEPHKNG